MVSLRSRLRDFGGSATWQCAGVFEGEAQTSGGAIGAARGYCEVGLRQRFRPASGCRLTSWFVAADWGLLATQRYKELHELTITQQNAIDLLVGGTADKEVAAALGVHRVTVTRWRLYHPVFQAALNARRVTVWQSAQDRFRALTLEAMDAIAADLKAPGLARGKLALRVVELSGIRSVNLGITGPSDPEVIVDEAIEADERREKRRAFSGPTEARRREVRLELLALANEPPDPDTDPESTT